jgi:hypothetical protein
MGLGSLEPSYIEVKNSLLLQPPCAAHNEKSIIKTMGDKIEG